MKTTSNLPRVMSAALAAACSLVLLATVAEQMNPQRLLAVPHVLELERVVVTAPGSQAAVAAAPADTAAN
jgi:hypothetical protein